MNGQTNIDRCVGRGTHFSKNNFRICMPCTCTFTNYSLTVFINTVIVCIVEVFIDWLTQISVTVQLCELTFALLKFLCALFNFADSVKHYSVIYWFATKQKVASCVVKICVSVVIEMMYIGISLMFKMLWKRLNMKWWVTFIEDLAQYVWTIALLKGYCARSRLSWFTSNEAY